MPELRWILLGLGTAFFLGLWWWETRRRRRAIAASRETAREFAHEADVDDVGFTAPGMTAPSVAPPLRPETRPVPAPYSRIEPTLDDVVPLAEERSEPRFDAPDAPAESSETVDPGAATDKIVSLRLLSTAGRPFAGEDLLDALLNAGLAHGKFGIFHRQSPEGDIVFSVASLTEPGSFDLAAMPGQTFRGVTFFALADEAGPDGLAAMRRAAEDVAGALRGTLSSGN